MKKNKSNRKLTIRRQTVRRLTNDLDREALRWIGGGTLAAATNSGGDTWAAPTLTACTNRTITG